MVGATGFEPATSCSRSRRSTGLSYAPPISSLSHARGCVDAPRRTRTANLLIRSQMLYPIELWALGRAYYIRILRAPPPVTRRKPVRMCSRARTCNLFLPDTRSEEYTSELQSHSFISYAV